MCIRDRISVDHNFINVFSTFTSEPPVAMDETLPDRLSSGLSSQFSFMAKGVSEVKVEKTLIKL